MNGTTRMLLVFANLLISVFNVAIGLDATMQAVFKSLRMPVSNACTMWQLLVS